MNENKPIRRARGAHSMSKGSNAASGTGAVSSDATQKAQEKAGKKVAPARRDNKPQYRTRTKSASKVDAKAAGRAATKPTAKSVSPRQSQTGKMSAVDRIAAVTGSIPSSKKQDAANTRGQSPVSKTQPSARVTARQEPVQAKRQTRSNARVSGALPPVPSETDIKKPILQTYKPNSKGPANRGASAGDVFGSFFRKNIKVCLPVMLVVIALVLGGIVDVATSFGRIHPGVKVGGVSVGGMSKETAATELENALSSVLEDNRVTVYASEKTAKKDGAEILSFDEEGGIVETANAAELSGSDVSGNGKSDKWTIAPTTVGAYVDGATMAEEAYKVGREGNVIVSRMTAWLGSFDLEPLLGFNDDSFNELTDEIDSSCGKKIKDSKITVSSGKAKVSEGSDGLLVNGEKLASMITRAMFSTQESKAFVAPMETAAMHIQPETAQRVADQVTAALSQNVKVTYDGESWKLDQEKLGDMLSQTVLTGEQYLKIGNGTQKKAKLPEEGSEEAETFELPYDTSAGLDESSGYTLQVYVNQETFCSYLSEILGSKANGGAKNARFDTSSGDKVKIIKSKNGNGPDRNAAALQLQDILFGTLTDRTIAMVDTVIEPELTTEEAKAMGVKEKLASWSIPLSGTSSRINNIKLLCKLINGSLIEPGGTWSFNETTGERTEEKGFQKAAVIVNGKHEDQLGGGVCQVATCVFNAVCYSGLGIVTRTNHDFYISAYDDEGFADATVSWDVPDLAWLNDTENYILLTAGINDEDVYVTLWGTDDGRKVTCERGEWKAGTKYKTIKENDPELEKGVTKVEQSGVDGRSITIHYLVKSKSGEVLHDIEFNSVYVPQNEIIKVGTKGSESESSSTKKSSESTSEGDGGGN